MLSEKQKVYILENKKWPFRFNDIFIQYGIFIPIILFGFILFAFLSKKYSIMELNEFIISGLLIIFLAFCTFISIKKINGELKFEEIESKKSNTEITECITENWNELKWILKDNKESTIVYSDIIVGFRQENIITIIKNSNSTFLINSRSNGNQPFTFWRNDKNISNLKKIIT